MTQLPPLDPIEIIHRGKVSLADVALEAGVSRDWYRKIAKHPRHHRRALIAALKVTLRNEQLAQTLESLVDAGRWG